MTNKYNAKRITVDSTTYDSKREAKVCEELRILEKQGFIIGLQIHPEWPLKVNGILITTYKADAAFYETRNGLISGDSRKVIDIKSPATAKRPEFILKKKLMKALHGIDVEVVF